jgi:uncharacterized coiled-coil DUF342 family protein
MGMVSYLEDIEKLRAEHEHFGIGVANLVARVRRTRSLEELESWEGALVELSERLIMRFEAARKQADELFEQAVELLRDPKLRLSEKMKKLERQRDEARADRDRAIAELAQARASQDRALKRARDLESELAQASSKLEGLQLQAEFRSAMADVRPTRKG